MFDGLELGGRTPRILNRVQKKCSRQYFDCLIPQCTQPAITSHFQQRRGQLREIAVNSHVYALDPSFARNVRRKDGGHRAGIVRTPIGSAAAHAGFCSQHDRELFADVECHELKQTSREQAIALAIRAVANEMAKRRQVLTFWMKLLEDNEFRLGQHFAIEAAAEDSISDGTVAYAIYETWLSDLLNCVARNDSDELRTAWCTIHENIDVSTCALIPMLVAFEGPPLPRHLPFMTLNIIPTRLSSHIVVSWLPYSSPWASRYLDGIDDGARFQVLVNRMAFCECEDTCISPRLWEKLTNPQQELLRESFAPPWLRNPNIPVPNIIRLDEAPSLRLV